MPGFVLLAFARLLLKNDSICALGLKKAEPLVGSDPIV
jgi:hypothetical protein